MDFTTEDYIKYFCNDGFLIPHLDAELPLHRFRGNIDFVVDEIENDHVFMAPIETLNDPFDSSFSLSYEEACDIKNTPMYYYLTSFFLSSKTWYKELKKDITKLPNDMISLKEFAEIVSSFAKKAGGFFPASVICEVYYQRCFHKPAQRRILGKVTCFSETWESIPMWSYYANSHKGVCMKYDFNLLDTEDITNKNICSSLQKVWYSERRYADAKSSFTPFVKSLQWAHEQEWRLFRESNDEYLYLPCLTEIYLGINFDYGNLERITDAVRKNQRDIRLFVIHPKPNEYSFEKIPLTLPK